MVISKYEYSGKSFDLVPYTTAQEKDLLLLSSIGDSTLENALEICGIEKDIVDSLSQDEKIAMLFKLREISVGNEIQLKFKCTHCGSSNENSTVIEDLVESSTITNEKIEDQFKVFYEDDIQDYINTDVEEMDMDEYEDILKEVKSTVTKFHFKRPIICQKCTKENYVYIDNTNFVLDNLSDDSLMSMYQAYNDLMFFGNYSKLDIDTLYPFERLILISLLNKTREDLNK